MCFPQDFSPLGQSDQTHPNEEKHQQEYASQKQPDQKMFGSEGKQ
jgi:hypothetical protein